MMYSLFASMIPFFHVLTAYLGGLLSFLILDGIMISQVILPLFRKHVGYLIGDMDIAAAVVFYLLYVLVGYFLVVAPAMNAHADWLVVARNGALFGFGAYMTYELTSKSFVK